MEALKSLDPMTLLISIAAVIICCLVLFNKAVKFMLKLAVIGVMLICVVYFLVQAGVIGPLGE